MRGKAAVADIAALSIRTADDAGRLYRRRVAPAKGVAPRAESGWIVRQNALLVWPKVIETTALGHHEASGKIRRALRASFLGDTGAGARGHGGPIGSPAQTRRRSWLSLHSSLRYLG